MTETATLQVEVRKEVSKKENKRLISNGYIIGVINQKVWILFSSSKEG